MCLGLLAFTTGTYFSLLEIVHRMAEKNEWNLPLEALTGTFNATTASNISVQV